MGNENLRYYQFGEFKLDSRRRILFKNGNRIDISAKNFELLYFLIQNEGRILTHDELLDAVWHGTFVEQSNLKKGISALRHLLEESPNESLYIRTIPRQGYSFVAPVVKLADEADLGPEINTRASQTEIYIEEIEEFVEDAPDDHLKALPSYSAKPSRKYLLAAISLVIVAVVSFASWKYFWGTSSPQRIGNVRIEKLSTDGECYGRISPDGNFIACVLKNDEGDSAIEIRQMATDSRRRIFSMPQSDIYAVLYSNDGNFIYYVLRNGSDPSKSGIYKISVLGGDAKFIVPDAGSIALASDGRLIFSRSNPEGGAKILMVDANGDGESIVTSFPGNFRVWDFKFSPNEKAVTVSLRKQLSDTKNAFYVSEFPLDGGLERVIVPERDTLIASTTWMPDQASLLLCIREKNADIRQVWQYFLSSGEMVRITNDNTSYKDVQILRDGKTISAIAEDIYTNIWIGEADKFDFRPITSGVQSIDRAFWLRDGRLGYAAVENSSELIRLMSEDGSSRERLSEGKDGYWIQPSLSGDGQSIAFNSNRSGLDQLWRIGIDGRNPTQVTRSEVPIFNGRLLSDGTAIYKVFQPGEGWLLIHQGADGTLSRMPIPDTNVWDISPDEKQFATVHEDVKSGEHEIVLYDLISTSELRRIKIKPKMSVERLIWDRDANGFTFVATDKSVSEIYRLPTTGGEARKISNFRHDRIYSLNWSFDGKKLALVRGRGFRDPVLFKSSL